MNVLIIDNRDSFTFNLVEACRTSGASVAVVRNSIAAEAAFERALAERAVLMLSPGPGGPKDAGCCLELIRLAKWRVPVIGICLGHQAIVEEAGGRVERAAAPCHGKVSRLTHGGEGIFAGLASPLIVGRYHSLCAPVANVPPRLRVDAELEGMAMAVSDDEAGQFGLQFHPESILTPTGDRLIAALLGAAGLWLEHFAAQRAALRAAE
ncbi:MAG: aminodeoxychorismate/anthranilate synthase component II [Sphingomonas bacterium]|nr:aminodeoxychorismate/anthranilate synthase component II [Sphingomonas bacterium]